MKKQLLSSVIFLLVSITFAFGQQRGNASYYSQKLHGRHTSDGGKYNRDSLTCAHRSYPFGTILKVRNPKNDREVIVKVTDRGPHQQRLMIDLSYSAAQELDIVRAGIAQVEITRLDSMPTPISIPELIPIPDTSTLIFPIPVPLPEIKIENSNRSKDLILAFIQPERI